MAAKPKLCIDCASHYMGDTRPGDPDNNLCNQGQEATVDPVDGSISYDLLKTCKMRRDHHAPCGPEGRLWTTRSPAPSMMRGECGDLVCTPIPTLPPVTHIGTIYGADLVGRTSTRPSEIPGGEE